MKFVSAHSSSLPGFLWMAAVLWRIMKWLFQLCVTRKLDKRPPCHLLQVTGKDIEKRYQYQRYRVSTEYLDYFFKGFLVWRLPLHYQILTEHKPTLTFEALHNYLLLTTLLSLKKTVFIFSTHLCHLRWLTQIQPLYYWITLQHSFQTCSVCASPAIISLNTYHCLLKQNPLKCRQKQRAKHRKAHDSNESLTE